MDAFEKVIDLLEGYPYKIHRNDEEDYAQLSDDDLCIEVINRNDENLFIEFRSNEVKVNFYFHEDRFDISYDDEIYWLIGLLDDILHNRRCAGCLFYRDDEFYKLMGSCFCKKSDIDKSVEEVFSFIFELDEYRKKLEINSGKASYVFWDPSLNKEVPINKKEELFH